MSASIVRLAPRLRLITRRAGIGGVAHPARDRAVGAGAACVHHAHGQDLHAGRQPHNALGVVERGQPTIPATFVPWPFSSLGSSSPSTKSRARRRAGGRPSRTNSSSMPPSTTATVTSALPSVLAHAHCAPISSWSRPHARSVGRWACLGLACVSAGTSSSVSTMAVRARRVIAVRWLGNDLQVIHIKKESGVEA